LIEHGLAEQRDADGAALVARRIDAAWHGAAGDVDGEPVHGLGFSFLLFLAHYFSVSFSLLQIWALVILDLVWQQGGGLG
jgi:hypothetical protein